MEPTGDQVYQGKKYAGGHCRLMCPTEECGPSRSLQLADVKSEDIVNVCF
jgi:hypothetical protein